MEHPKCLVLISKILKNKILKRHFLSFKLSKYKCEDILDDLKRPQERTLDTFVFRKDSTTESNQKPHRHEFRGVKELHSKFQDVLLL